MDLLKMFRSEPKVGVGDAQGFQHEICKLEPNKRLELIQGMAGAGKESAALDKDGNIKFDGQFTIGSSGGTSSGNKFNLGNSGAPDTVSIIDSHNNRVNVFCGDSAVATTAKSEGELGAKAGSFSNDQLNAALTKAGIDPKTFLPLKKATADDAAPITGGVMESRSDIELANHTHIVIDQIGDKPPTITLPDGLRSNTMKDGAIEVKLKGGTIRFADGGISSTGDIGGIKNTTTNKMVSDKP